MAKLCSYLIFLSLSLNYYFFTCLAMSRKNMTTDEFSLLAFKSSITLNPYDLMVHNWSTSSSVCNWVGVTCDEQHGRVHALNLSNMGLKGTISPQLGNLSFLVDLDLQGNAFNGELPQSLFQLHRLKLLNLSNNMLSGTIPQRISNLSSLEEITLANNSLSGDIPKGMGDLTQLRTMDIGYNDLSGNLPSNICKGLPKLRILNLFHNHFSGDMPTVWHQCENLERLILSNNGFNKGPIPEDMGNLNKLQHLYLSGNNLEGGIPFSLYNITTLKIVNISGNNLNGILPSELCHPLLPQLERFVLDGNQFEGRIPRSIGNCTLLKSLSLNDNHFTGSIPEEIGKLDQLVNLQLANNRLSGHITSKLFNISTLSYLSLINNSLSGTLPIDMGRGCPNLEVLQLRNNMLVGNIPNGIANASMLTQIDLQYNQFSGTVPDVFGGLTDLECLHLDFNNNLKLEDSFGFNFLTSLTGCRQLKYLSVSGTRLSKLPKSIGNLTVGYFWAQSSGINGNLPLEIGNMSNLVQLYLSGNDINGPIPSTTKGLHNLQTLYLDDNGLQGSIDELCEIKSLSDVYLSNNKFSGALPTCLGNMTSLSKVHIGANRLTSEIPSSFWNLKDILEVNLSNNAITGNLSMEIGKLRAITLLNLSGNQISGNIPEIIGLSKTLSFLDLSHNLLTGVIPKSLENLVSLESINVSYNMLQGEIPDGGQFKNFTAQSFMHNKALCGNPLLQVPPCDKHRRSIAKTLLIKCMLPVIVSAILVAGCIILVLHKRKKDESPHKSDLSTIGVPKRISYYELVQATSGFSESNLLGKGGFGSVYQGLLSSGEMVAVKVIDLNFKATSRSFDVECNAMRNLRHRNLVEIISSCSNVDFKSLVMKFMSNGSVEKKMVQTLSMPVAPSLSIISKGHANFSNRVSFPVLNTPKSKVQRLNIVCVRVGGVEIPNNKRIEFSLQYIHGVGRNRARQILTDISMENKVTKELSEEELISLRDEVNKYMTEGDLRRFNALNIKRLKEIQCYRGIRHIQGLPCRGQRTKNNCRTLKGKKVTVAGKKKK